MATWTPSTDSAWTGKIITAIVWNQYFGANSSVQYIKETYARYFQSFAATVSVPASTLTQMETFTIPVGWDNGLYFISMNVEPSAASDAPAAGRRQVSANLNGSVIAANNYLSELSTGGVKTTYNIALYNRLSVGDIISYRFFQIGATNTNFVVRASIQKVGV